MEGLRDYCESDSSEGVQSPVTDHKKASASEPPPDQEIKDDVVPAERKVTEKPRKEGREECRSSSYGRGTHRERSYQGSGRYQRRSRSRSPEHRRKPHQYRPHQKRRSRSPEIHRHSRSQSPDHHRRGSRSPERHKWQRSRSPVSYRKPAAAGARTHKTHASPPRGSQHGKSTSKYSHPSGTVREDIQKNSGGFNPRQRNTGVPSASVPTVVYEDGVKLTPEQKLERALAAAQAIAPKLPNYMNPGAMNPVRFQTLQDKKKLLWSKKKEGGQSKNQWESASFSGESGGEAQAKFRRLMGISAAPPPTEADNEELRQKHARTMSDLEHQYELSRYTTHIARGVGFGYGSGTLLSEPPKPSGPPP